MQATCHGCNPCNPDTHGEPFDGAERVARILLSVVMRIQTLLVIGLCIPIAGLARAQPYVSAQLGFANTEWSQGSPLNGTIDDRGLGYGVDVGLGFGKRWAVELGAYGYESFDARGTPCAGGGAVCSGVVSEVSGNDIDIVKAALAPRFRIGNNVQLFATLGYYRATIDTNLALPEAKSRERGAVVGVGARWYFTNPWSVSLQATRFDDNLQQLMLGVGWGLRRDPRNGDN